MITTPWKAKIGKLWESGNYITDNNGETIAHVYWNEETTKLIVHAVNTYIEQGRQLQELVDKLEAAEKEIDRLKTREKMLEKAIEIKAVKCKHRECMEEIA